MIQLVSGEVDLEELRALLHLRALPGLGDVRIGRLLDRYGSALAALEAPPEMLGAAAEVRGSRRVLGHVERSLETIERLGLHVLLEEDAWYPPGARELHDPPPILFARGRLELLVRPAIAVVGARRHTEYGARIAAMLAGELADAGFAVVSGMARGIDAAAHLAALEAAGEGGTIGVLGCGVDVVYPRSHGRLYERIAREGLLISEFLPGEPAQRHNFPRRNRIIAALSEGVLVVEAGERSGALITADHALDLGREVFAVPGPIDRATSVGTHRLIREGATLVSSVLDIVTELKRADLTGTARDAEWATKDEQPGLPFDPDPPPGLSGVPLRVWKRLEPDPLHIDELVSACGLDPARTVAALLELELAGLARKVTPMRFARAQ